MWGVANATEGALERRASFWAPPPPSTNHGPQGGKGDVPTSDAFPLFVLGMKHTHLVHSVGENPLY